jgi:hypothetical protein
MTAWSHAKLMTPWIYFSFHYIQIEMYWSCSTNWQKMNVYRILVGNPRIQSPLGTSSRRRVDNIKMDFVEIGWGGVDWIGRAQDRYRWRALVNAVMNLRVQ